MHGSAKLKVPGGKLVSVKVTYSDRIESVQILGDFFMHPEESLGSIESALKGANPRASADEISLIIKGLAEREGIEMIGVTPESIAQAIRMAIA